MPGLRRDGAREPLLLLLGQALVGVVVGVGWWAATRHPAAWMVGEPVLTSSLQRPVARDGLLAVAELMLGALAGVVVLRRGVHRPGLLLAAGVCGALAGSLLAVGVGGTLPPADTADPAHVGVSAWGVTLLWPFALCAVVALTTLASALVEWVRDGPSPADVADEVREAR